MDCRSSCCVYDVRIKRITTMGLLREYINAAMAAYYTRRTISSRTQLRPQDASSVLIVLVRKRCLVSYLLFPNNHLRLSSRNILAVGLLAERTGQTYAGLVGQSNPQSMRLHIRLSQHCRLRGGRQMDYSRGQSAKCHQPSLLVLTP